MFEGGKRNEVTRKALAHRGRFRVSEVENNDRVRNKLQQERDHKVPCMCVEGSSNSNSSNVAAACVCGVLTQREADLIAHSQELTEGHGVVRRRQAQLVHPGGRRWNTGIILCVDHNQSLSKSQRERLNLLKVCFTVSSLCEATITFALLLSAISSNTWSRHL